MRLNIFLKAKNLLVEDKVKITSVNQYSISFDVGGYHVIAKYQNHQLIWLCDCKADANGDLCSHKIAAQDYLLNTNLEDLYNKEKETEINIPVVSSSIGLEHLTDAQKFVLRQMVCFRCQLCKREEKECGKLEIHRIKRGEHGGLYTPNNILVLCEECHKLIT